MNLYFQFRQVLPHALIYASEALIERSFDPHDTLLGMICRGIGYFWGDFDQLLFGCEVIDEAVRFADEECLKVQHSDL
jgi:hypothetical protein